MLVIRMLVDPIPVRIKLFKKNRIRLLKLKFEI